MKLQLWSRTLLLSMMCFLWLPSVQAQETLYRLYKMAQGASKVYSAYNLTDAKIQEYASQTVRSYDSENTVCGTSSKYTLRLKKITAGMKTLNGVKLNFKVYLDGNTPMLLLLLMAAYAYIPN